MVPGEFVEVEMIGVVVMEQGALFSAEPYRVETYRPRVEIPVSGVRWRRTALRRDCRGCWEQQHEQYAVGAPLMITRQRASAELQIWSDSGELTHHGFYCMKHAEALGWDGSRSKDRRRRIDPEVEARTQLVFQLQDLVTQVRSGRYPTDFTKTVNDLLVRAGAYDLAMPQWEITGAGGLSGRFTVGSARAVQSWAERWNTTVDDEPITKDEHCVSAYCRILLSPPLSVRVYGYFTTAA